MVKYSVPPARASKVIVDIYGNMGVSPPQRGAVYGGPPWSAIEVASARFRQAFPKPSPTRTEERVESDTLTVPPPKLEPVPPPAGTAAAEVSQSTTEAGSEADRPPGGDHPVAEPGAALLPPAIIKAATSPPEPRTPELPAVGLSPPRLTRKQQAQWLKGTIAANPPGKDEPITAKGYGKRIADMGRASGAIYEPSSIPARYYQLNPEAKKRRRKPRKKHRRN
jgi:hypothetical protein